MLPPSFFFKYVALVLCPRGLDETGLAAMMAIATTHVAVEFLVASLSVGHVVGAGAFLGLWCVVAGIHDVGRLGVRWCPERVHMS